MSGSDLHSRLHLLPRGLLGMLVLVVAVERFAARHQRDLFLRIDDWSWQQTGRLARESSPAPEIICLGDSLVQVGVAPPIIEERTGKRTCNLAISGGHAAASYFLLRRALDAGARPKALLVDFFPRHLEADPLQTLDPWRALASPRECVDLAWTARDARFLGQVATAKLFPTFGSRGAIRESLIAAFSGEDRHDRQFVPPFLRRNLRLNRGGVLCPRSSEKGAAEDLAAWSRRYFDPAWTCHPLSRVYVDRVLDLARSHGIRVFWLLPPIRPELQAECERSGFDDRHVAFVRSFQAHDPNVTVIDGRHARYDPKVFFDPHHLDRDGAAVFSAEVSETVRRVVGGDPEVSRWVLLPTYRERSIDVPLEDIEQSKLALRLEGARPRR